MKRKRRRKRKRKRRKNKIILRVPSKLKQFGLNFQSLENG